MAGVVWVLLGIVAYLVALGFTVAFLTGCKKADEVEADIRSSWLNR